MKNSKKMRKVSMAIMFLALGTSTGCRNWCVTMNGLHSKDANSGKCNTPGDNEQNQKK